MIGFGRVIANWRMIGLFVGLKLAATALLFMALAGPSSAQSRDKLVLAPDSSTAMIVIKTDWWQPATEMQSAFKILLSTYDPEQAKLGSAPGFAGGGALIEVKRKKLIGGYLIMPIKPGRWVYQAYQQQDKWTLCFNAATLQFDVKPGEVVYLGEFDGFAHRDWLTRKVRTSGRGTISGYGFVDFFDLEGPPTIKPIDDAGIAAVNTMLATQAPQVSAPVRAAIYTPATFGTGSTLFAERRCGGYFVKGAKKTKKSKS